MKGKLEKLLGKIGRRIQEAVEVAAVAYGEVKDDITKLCALKRKQIEVLIDKVVIDQFWKLGEAVLDAIKDGKDAAAKALSARYDQLDSWLQEQVQANPEAVGFWDGFVDAFVGNARTRRPRSTVYTTHRKYGRVVGFSTAVLLFVPAGGVRGIRALIGAMPALSRSVTYLLGKVAEAKEQVKKG